MRKNKKTLLKLFHFILLIFVIAFGFILIVPAGGGSRGSSDITSNHNYKIASTSTSVNAQLTASDKIGAIINLLLLSEAVWDSSTWDSDQWN